MLLYGPAQPVLPECHGDSKATDLFTIAERRKLADEIGRGEYNLVPMTLNHAGLEHEPEKVSNFKVPNKLNIGRLVWSFVCPNGVMYAVTEINHEHDKLTKAIVDDMKTGRRRWGFSLGLDIDETVLERDVVGKRLNHIGLTDNPEWGNAEHGATWIQLASLDKNKFYRELYNRHLSKEPDMYFPDKARERLAEFIPELAQPPVPQSEAAHLLESPPPEPDVALPPEPAPPAMTTEVATPQQQQQQPPVPAIDYTDLHARFVKFIDGCQQKVRDDNGTEVDKLVYSNENFLRAAQFENEYRKLIATGQWPGEAMTDYSTLHRYIKAYQATQTDHLNQLGLPAPVLEKCKEAVKDPFNPSGMDRESLSSVVVASNNWHINNQAQFRHERNEHRKALQDLEVNHKRDRETWEKEKTSWTTEKDTITKELSEKRARLEELEKKYAADAKAQALEETKKQLNTAGSVPGATAAGITPQQHQAMLSSTVGASSGTNKGKFVPYAPIFQDYAVNAKGSDALHNNMKLHWLESEYLKQSSQVDRKL